MRILGKRILLTVLGMLALAAAFPTAGQDTIPAVIENPAKPPARNADRLVELKEVLRITDEGGEFFFKYPYKVQVGPGGSIFVQEQEQLLKFDARGKFIRNFFRKGQGPGEALYVGGFLPEGSGLIIQGASPAKMVWYGEDGDLIKESALRCSLMGFRFLGKSEDLFTYAALENPIALHKGTTPAVIAVGHHVFAWREGQADLQEKGVFPVDIFVIKSSSGGGGMIPVSDMLTALSGGKRLFLSHTQEYLIKVLDLESKAIVRTFRRAYKRVDFEPPKKGGVNINGQSYTHAPRKYASDIDTLHSVGDDLWVVTSTRDKAGNPLIDVFNKEGRYKDCFYLLRPAGAVDFFLKANQCVIKDGCLYQIEWREEDVPSIAKYELLDRAAVRNP
jgi:hypothetical protein